MFHGPLRWLSRWLLLGGAFAMHGAQSEPIISVPAYSYYTQPPFVTPDGGLTADLVAYLNKAMGDKYVLHLENQPHSRLTRKYLKDPMKFRGVVLATNPRFMDDGDQTRFYWSPVLFMDSDVFVFSKPKAVPVAAFSDLKGKRFGGILEHRYMGVDEMVSLREIERFDADSELNNLKLLDTDRIDFTIMGFSAYSSLKTGQGYRHDFVSQRIPSYNPFARQILIGKSLPDLANRVSRVVKQMPDDPQWQAIIKKHHVNSLQQ